jgi:hypothetical protein
MKLSKISCVVIIVIIHSIIFYHKILLHMHNIHAFKRLLGELLLFLLGRRFQMIKYPALFQCN